MTTVSEEGIAPSVTVGFDVLRTGETANVNILEFDINQEGAP